MAYIYKNSNNHYYYLYKYKNDLLFILLAYKYNNGLFFSFFTDSNKYFPYPNLDKVNDVNLKKIIMFVIEYIKQINLYSVFYNNGQYLFKFNKFNLYFYKYKNNISISIIEEDIIPKDFNKEINFMNKYKLYYIIKYYLKKILNIVNDDKKL